MRVRSLMHRRMETEVNRDPKGRYKHLVVDGKHFTEMSVQDFSYLDTMAFLDLYDRFSIQRWKQR